MHALRRQSEPPPRVSILTAARDALPDLDTAIESIRAQTLTAWQWVIIDDGSTDGTSAALDTWATRDPRLEVTHTAPRGIVSALNSGLAQCRAPIIARMDADDIARPERLALQVAALDEDQTTTVVDGRVELIGGERNEGMLAYVDWVNAHGDHASIVDDIFVESPIVHPAACLRTAALHAVGGYRDGDFPEDYDLWLRLFRSGARFQKLGATLLQWRDRPDRLTRTDQRYRSAAFTRIKQEHLWEHEGHRMQGAPFVLWGAGRAKRPWRQWLAAHEIRPELVVDTNPRRRHGRILGAPIVEPETIRGRTIGYLLVTVSSPESRASIRRDLQSWNFNSIPGTHIRFV